MVSLASTRWAILAAVLALAYSSDVDAKPIVHPGVHRALRAQTTVNLVLTMVDGVEAPIINSLDSNATSKGDKIAELVESLQVHANETQSEVTAVLAEEADGLYSDAKSFWVSNQVYIQEATVSLLTKLVKLSSVYEIREEMVLPLPTLGSFKEVNSNTTATSTTGGYTGWGVTKIGAPSVWAKGYTGQGVVVSHIDTGVRYTHEVLKSSFRSSYGWYDPESETATPYDSYGHGTHTMGTMVGSGSIGVAPGATWISCKGCRSNSCYESDLLACAEFITCPTDTSGNNADCSKAPDVVGNSWGGGQGETFYAAAIQTWIAAGIIPVFSNGNDGPECGTANSPGDDASVIAVGATTSADALADYSSKGAAVTGIIKPDISAPGSSVTSSYYLSDTSYATGSGTSMACPHVTGTIALLLSINSSLTYEDIRTILFETTDLTISSTGYSCNGTTDADIPNNQFGYGRLNALTAATAL